MGTNSQLAKHLSPALFIFWTIIDAFFAAWWEGMIAQDMHPRWLDWFQAKAHRQRWKAEKRLEG